METCPICFGAVHPQNGVEHMKYHKRHNHHGVICASFAAPMYHDGAGNLMPNPCTCEMQFVYT